MTARTRPLLLRHSARLAGGHVAIDGKPWNSPDISKAVVEAAGPSTGLIAAREDERFDVLPLLIATDGMLEAVGYDRRRFPPNSVIGVLRDSRKRIGNGGPSALEALLSHWKILARDVS